MRSALWALSLSVALASCGAHDSSVARLVVDLNMTTSEPMRLVPLVLPDDADSAAAARLVQPDRRGAFVCCTDSLPSGIYLCSWDSAHSLPLLLHRHQEQRVFATWQHLDQARLSSVESRALLQVEALRRRLKAASDSIAAIPHLSRRTLADTISCIYADGRRMADRLLASADTSLAALPILGLAGVYDPLADDSLFLASLQRVELRHPDFPQVRSLKAQVSKLHDLKLLRARFAPGSDAPAFKFLRLNGDSAVAPWHKPLALALITDSASVPVADLIARVSGPLRQGRAFVSARRAASLDGRTGVVFGSFLSLEMERQLRLFAPAVLIIGPDGKVERLFLSDSAIPQ